MDREKEMGVTSRPLTGSQPIKVNKPNTQGMRIPAIR